MANESKIIQNFKKMCKNLSVLNLPNEGDDLILETDGNNEHWSAVLKIKEGEKLHKYYREVLIRQNVSHDEKRESYKRN